MSVVATAGTWEMLTPPQWKLARRCPFPTTARALRPSAAGRAVRRHGRLRAGGIISAIGDLAHVDYDEVKVATYAGCTWKRRQSGQRGAEETQLDGQPILALLPMCGGAYGADAPPE